MKAVIPAAGHGTRFLPLTNAQPKEMLPIVNKPAIQWVVEEAVDAGIKEIGIIIGNHKKAIKNHFKVSSKADKLESLYSLTESTDIKFIYQEEQKGLGHAILCAEEFVADSPFVILLGDTICAGNPNCTESLIDIFSETGKNVFAVEEVETADVSRYGILDGEKLGKDLLSVNKLVEKPSPEESPSNMAILGRYLFKPEIFSYLKETKPGFGGEIQLTDSMDSLSQEKKVLATIFRGERYDIGNISDWFTAHIELSLKSDYSGLMKDLIRKITNE